MNERIWIMGASEGIGAALAQAWAQRGAKLILGAVRGPAGRSGHNWAGRKSCPTTSPTATAWAAPPRRSARAARRPGGDARRAL